MYMCAEPTASVQFAKDFFSRPIANDKKPPNGIDRFIYQNVSLFFFLAAAAVRSSQFSPCAPRRAPFRTKTKSSTFPHLLSSYSSSSSSSSSSSNIDITSTIFVRIRVIPDNVFGSSHLLALASPTHFIFFFFFLNHRYQKRSAKTFTVPTILTALLPPL